MRFSLKISVVVGSTLALLGIFASLAVGEMLTVTLEAEKYQIVKDEKGLQRIVMDGFGSLSQPGEPCLPGRIFYIALPPLAKVHSVTVEAIASHELPGVYNLVPMPAVLPWTEQDKDGFQDIMEEWEHRRREGFS